MPPWAQSEKQMIETKFTRRHVGAARQLVFRRFDDFMGAFVEPIASRLESPIEAAFYIWWYALGPAGARMISDDRFELVPQVEVSVGGQGYRLDFAICPHDEWRYACEEHGVTVPRIAIELDGHAFHERTKEQVAYRNARQRALGVDGWVVLHYSGSELNRDPIRCVHGAWLAATKLYWPVESALFAKGFIPSGSL